MTSYRLYSVDRTGKITGAQWLHAGTDREAIDLARALNTGSSCEIWNRNKFVESISISEVQKPPALNAL